jgi:hypothetical protein
MISINNSLLKDSINPSHSLLFYLQVSTGILQAQFDMLSCTRVGEARNLPGTNMRYDLL